MDFLFKLVPVLAVVVFVVVIALIGYVKAPPDTAFYQNQKSSSLSLVRK